MRHGECGSIGTRGIAHWCRSSRGRLRSSGHAWRAAVATGLLLAAVSAVTRPPAEPLVGIRDVPQGREPYRAMGALAEREPVRAVFFNPRDVARVPGVSALSVPRGSIEHLERELRSYRINYAILGSMGRERSADTLLGRIATERPDVFGQVFSNDSVVVYRIVNAAPGLPNRKCSTSMILGIERSERAIGSSDGVRFPAVGATQESPPHQRSEIACLEQPAGQDGPCPVRPRCGCRTGSGDGPAADGRQFRLGQCG